MTGNTHFPLLTFGLFLLLCGCGRSGETDNGAKAPTDLSGAWRLEQRQYPGGGTYLADLEHEAWRMRLYEGDSVFYEYDMRCDSSGTVIVPHSRQYFTLLFTPDSTLAYYEGEDPHPLERLGDSALVIQSFGSRYTWRRYPLSDELRRTLLTYGADGERQLVISVAEHRLQRENHLLTYVLLLALGLLSFAVMYARRTLLRKRRIERQLRAISEERQLRPAIVSDAMQRVADEFMRSAYYTDLRRRLREGGVLSDDDWREMERQIRAVWLDFVRRLSELVRLSEVEWRTCLLIRLKLSPSDMTRALCREASSISSIRSRLYAKVFGTKGSPRDWDDFILSL